jgi:hypothetical protein
MKAAGFMRKSVSAKTFDFNKVGPPLPGRGKMLGLLRYVDGDLDDGAFLSGRIRTPSGGWRLFLPGGSTAAVQPGSRRDSLRGPLKASGDGSIRRRDERLRSAGISGRRRQPPVSARHHSRLRVSPLIPSRRALFATVGSGLHHCLTEPAARSIREDCNETVSRSCWKRSRSDFL